jgi:hypothetical protein
MPEAPLDLSVKALRPVNSSFPIWVSAGGFGSFYLRTVTVASYFINDKLKKKRIANAMTGCMRGRKTATLGAVTPLEPKVKVASQSVFYALRTRDGTCESGCGVSQTRVAEIVFGVDIVEWDLCSACLSRTRFLEYFNSLASATPRESEEIKILLGISNETLERQN